MKVLFVKNSYNQTLDSRLSNGMGIIATIVHNAGHNVKVVDNNTRYKFYKDNDIIKIIRTFNPDVLAYSITLYNSYQTYQQVKKIKKLFPNLKIIAGGIHMKYCFEEALRYGIDMVVNREGEKVILSLLDNLNNPEKVKGVSFIKKDGTFHITKEFPLSNNLDDVLIVNYGLFNLEDYDLTEEGLFDVTGQRGCPFNCSFCSDEYQRADKRIASAKWMFKNVEDLYKKYDVRQVFIADNNITIFPERLKEFCEMMINSGLNKKVSLSCQTTIRFPIDEELIKLMKKAGFNKIIFGIERLSPYSLKMINKKQDIENAHKVFKLMKKYEMEISIFMMVGFPFENKKLLEKERKLFLELAKYTKELHLSILTPMPGTIYYDEYPKIKEWYLEKDEYLLSRAYFNSVLDIPMFHTIEKNFFNLPKEVQEAMVDYYFTFKQVDRNKGYVLSFFMGIDFLVAKLSQGIFYLSPSVEFFLFNKLKVMKHNLGNSLIKTTTNKASKT